MNLFRNRTDADGPHLERVERVLVLAVLRVLFVRNVEAAKGLRYRGWGLCRADKILCGKIIGRLIIILLLPDRPEVLLGLGSIL